MGQPSAAHRSALRLISSSGILVIREVSNIAALRHFLPMAIEKRRQEPLFYAAMHDAAQRFISAAIPPFLLAQHITTSE